MQNIDDLAIDDLFEAPVAPQVDEAELAKEREAKRQALRSKIRAKRSMRQGNIDSVTNTADLANILDNPAMSDIVHKLLKGNNLNLLMDGLGDTNTKNAKTLSKIVNK